MRDTDWETQRQSEWWNLRCVCVSVDVWCAHVLITVSATKLRDVLFCGLFVLVLLVLVLFCGLMVLGEQVGGVRRPGLQWPPS